MNELGIKIDSIKEEVALDMKTSEKNDREIQKTMEGLSSRLKQAKDRISEDRI
jgi:hypothetical protein